MSPRIRGVRAARLSISAGLLVCLCGGAHGAEQWKIQYSYAKPESALEIVGFQCLSAQRCVGAGTIGEKNGHEKGILLLTSDGGRNWSLTDFKERPISLFFLNDSLGWMVTDHGVWTTNESGRTWKKLDALKKGIVRVHFLDPLRGFAIGFPRAAYETSDGGKTWSKIGAAEVPQARAEDTVYDCISFWGQHGVITGRVAEARAEREPIWLNPEEAKLRRQRRSTVVILETLDGGKNWKAWTSSAFGNITRVQMTADGSAVALFEYREYYSVPSSVAKLNFELKGVKTLFREADRAVTDFALLPNGEAILAAVEPPGTSNQVPIPGKVKILRSRNSRVWVETDADYRAVAQRVMLAAPDAKHILAATDTGMILNLIDTQDSTR